MSAAASPQRLQSLDQFRGYTVAGMLLVNFVGGFAVTPQVLKHTHDYCSYADTIMPHFLFAAGFALRLSFLKHQQHGGGREAWLRMIRRAVGLALIAIVWYSLGEWHGIRKSIDQIGLWTTIQNCAKRNWLQTLLHIAITSVWIMPVIWTPIGVRFAYGVASAVAHVALSWWFHFLWVNGIPGGVNGIDGGPLGFLTWSIVALAGTWACDLCRNARHAAPADQPANYDPAMLKMLIAGSLLAGLGWLFSCGTTIYDVPQDQLGINRFEELKRNQFGVNPVIPSSEELAAWDHRPAEPPFVQPPPISERKWNYWMMSQRAGTLSYLTFSAGFSLLVFTIFVWLADVKGIRFGVFRTLGVNALAGYMLADLTDPIAMKWTADLFGPIDKKTATVAVVGTAFAIHFLMVYAVLRLMEWRRVYFRM